MYLRLFPCRQSVQFFKLCKIVFGAVGVDRTVICFFADMYYIANVSESEKNGGNVGYYVPTVAYNVKILEPYAYIAPQTAVNHAWTAETVAENIGCNVGTVIYAEFVTKQGKRRAVGIAYDYDTSHVAVADLRFKVLFCGLPDAQKTTVNVPFILHFPVRLCREVEIVAPIDYAVAVLEEYVQYIAPFFIKKRGFAFGYGRIFHTQNLVKQIKQIFLQYNTPSGYSIM